MKRILQILLAMLCIAGPVSAQTEQPLTRVQNAISGLAGLSIEKLISDRLVQEFINSGDWRLYGARRVVLDELFCEPVFKDRHDSNSRTCFGVLYEAAGVEVESRPPLVQATLVFRTVLLGVAKAYFNDPDRLWGVYEQHREAALQAVCSLESDKRAQFQTALDSVYKTLATFYSQDTQDLYQAFVDAEKISAAFKDPQSWSTSPSLRTSQNLARIEEDLEKKVGGIPFVRFVARRHTEGGRVLVEMYGSVVEDFVNQLHSRCRAQ